jgi:nitrate reductase cytochrome c-type subunit
MKPLLVALVLSAALGCTDGDAQMTSARARETAKLSAAEAKAPPSIVVEGRKDNMDGYPCHECHDDSNAPNTTVRELKDAHTDITLVHGNGRFWCTTCHGGDKDKDSLVSLKGERIDFDQQYLLCGQCHFEKQREFLYGAHGKHLGTWRGERTVAACTSCHDAHDPAIKPRKPWRGPDAKR